MEFREKAIENHLSASNKYINKDNNSFVIEDDGGMTNSDFQSKFPKIGYFKRHDDKTKLEGER